jgi:phage tail-like protein
VKPADAALLLPGVFQRAIVPGSPLAALLAIMEALHAPDEAALDNLADTFHPLRAPDRFVAFLARWVDLDEYLVADAATGVATLPSGHGNLRLLVGAATELSKARGTARGLIRFLEVATGVTGFSIDEQPLAEDGRPRPFHFRVSAPAEAAPLQSLVERIVASEKPAYCTAEVVVQ